MERLFHRQSLYSTNLSLWEGDYPFGQKYLMSKPMATTPEAPEQEMEHTLEPEAENLSTHMERQACLMLERLTIHDLELSLEAGNVPEKLPSPSAECRPQTPPLPNGNQPEAEHKVASKSAEVQNACSIGAEATPQVTGKGSLANRYLEKIGQLRGATEFSQGSRDTCTLAEDLTTFDVSQKQHDRNKKEEFGELCTKLPGATQFALKLQEQTRVQTNAVVSDGEESSADFDRLPFKRRVNFWKRLEDHAIRNGLIVSIKMAK